MGWADIAKHIGISRMQVYNYKLLAIKYEKIPVDDNGKEIISQTTQLLRDYAYIEKNQFASDPLVKEWILDLRTRKQGNPVKTWKNQVSSLYNLCNSCKINPEQLLIDKKTTETIIKNWSELYVNEETSQKYKINTVNPQNAIHTKVMTTRSFCGFYGITWPKGTSGIMSGRTIGHGKYPDIRLSLDELEQANQYIKKRWGLDSDIYRIFWVGVESCARKTALLDMKCEWIKHKDADKEKTIFLMTVFESKTSHIKDGKWRKYITREETQHSLQIHKNKGFVRIWIHTGTNKPTQDMIREQLREIYSHLGKQDAYYYRNPFHTLRHIGAHYWLEKTQYNYGFVAKIGGWHTIDELKTSYGEMPSEFVIDMIESKIMKI